MNKTRKKISIFILIVLVFISGYTIRLNQSVPSQGKHDGLVHESHGEKQTEGGDSLFSEQIKDENTEQKPNDNLLTAVVMQEKQQTDERAAEGISDEEVNFEEISLNAGEKSIMSLLRKSHSAILSTAGWDDRRNDSTKEEEIITKVYAAARKDEMVEEAQNWFNLNYAGRNGLEAVEVTGRTGHAIVDALISALQVELGIAEPTGYFGATTTRLCPTFSAYDTLPNSNIMKILQYGLYCKGYSAGTVDGTFNSATLASIKKLQSDAGLTANGVVTPMIFKAVLSTDAMVLVYGGDPQIRLIQQYLNGHYYQYIGVKPCDGIYSRDTNKALIYALQKEEGLSPEEATGSFRDYTTTHCPTVKKGDKNSNVVRILQFGLYVNGYHPGNFDGNYTEDVAAAVAEFNRFMCLSGDGNQANVTTIKGLLTSCGDTDDTRRPGNACDTSSILTQTQINQIKSKGYTYVGRYISGTVKNASGIRVSKALTKEEATLILNNGLSIIPIYQEGYPEKDRYTAISGNDDAVRAVKAAQDIGLPKGSIIYFAVDYDVLAADIDNNIIPYFRAVNNRIWALGNYYQVGIYAPRHVCTLLSEAGLTRSSYVSDMSTGYCYNMGFKMPANWAFDQIAEDTTLNLDKVIASGRDKGVTRLSYHEAKPYNEAYIIPSQKDYYKGDPVNIATGAHNISYNAVTVYGGQELQLQLNYSSDSLAEGSMGIGWYYNYEMSVKKSEDGYLVYQNPSNYLIYTKKENSKNEYICNLPGRKNDVLKVNDNGTYTINCGKETTYTFDEFGRLISENSKNGFGITISYDTELIKITEVISGKSITLSKNKNGLITDISDGAGNVCHLTYDSNHYLCSITDGVGKTTSYTYDFAGRVLTGTDADGVCYFRDEYDEFGRVVRQYDGIEGSNPTYFSYNDSSVNGDTIVTVTDRTGSKNTSIFNSNRQLIKTIDANGNTVSYEYDANGNITANTDGLGNQSSFTYNEDGKILSETDRNGGVTEYRYDFNNNLIRKIYPNGADETFVYDKSGTRMITSEDINGQITEYEYFDNGLLKKKVIGDSEYTYTYENGRIKTLTAPNGGITTYYYDASGRVIKVVDAESNCVEKSYDKIGQVLTITNADGSVLSYTYNGRGQAETFCDANGTLTKYFYNANGMLTAKENADGNSIRYEYDGEDRLIKTTDKNGNVSTITYDGAGQIVSETDANGGVTTFEYDAAGNLIKRTNPSGSYIVRTYDADGNILTEMDADGVTVKYVYDSMSYIIKSYNTQGYKTDYTLNPAGQILSAKDSMGNTISNEYDVNGNLIRTIDANGNETLYEYDNCQNLIKITDAQNNETSFTYDLCSNKISATDAKGNTYFYTYDSCGRCTGITNPLGYTKTTEYDKNGNVIKTTDFNGTVVARNTYDSDNRMIQSIDALGNTIHVSYDAGGNILEMTDAKGNKTTYEYDALNQMTKSLNPLGKASTVSYDADGRTVMMQGPSGTQETYDYTHAGRLTAEQTVTDEKVTYGYDKSGLLTEKTNARGQKTIYAYNSLGNVTSVQNSEGITEYQYDAAGNIIRTKDSKSEIKRTFDSNNRVVTYTNNKKSIVYAYDAVGNISSLTYPDGTQVHYTYDSANQMTSVRDWNNRITWYEYDANGNITKMTRPDGSILTKRYDAAQHLIESADIKADGTIISKYAYSYDANGNIICEISYGENVRYDMSYDAMDRVTLRQKTDLTTNAVLDTETFTYDDACNIISSKKQGSIIAMTYDIRNRLKTVSGQECQYDADGNMILGPSGGSMLGMQYDSSNRLIKAGNTKYTYDAENVRIAKEDAAGKTNYVYGVMGQSSVLLESFRDDGTVVKYVYGAGALISQESPDGTSYFHYDLRGSTVALTDDGGQIMDRYQYDVYGQVTHTAGNSTTPFLYNGRDGVMTEENGLLYMRARYYSPELKRFINADVLVGNIGDSDTMNRYAYVEGNPISMIDPFGLCAEPGNKKKKNSGGFFENIKSGWQTGKRKVMSGFHAVASGTKKFFSAWTASDFIHTAFDGLGLIPIGGAIFDGSNVLYYLIEGDAVNAGISGIALLPVVGEFSTGGKYAVKVADGVGDFIRTSDKISGVVQDITKYADKIIDIGRYINVIGKVGKYIDKIVGEKESEKEEDIDEKNEGKSNPNDLGDADIKDLDKLPKDKIKEVGGENYTQGAKKNTGKSKSDLYWDKEGNVYSVPKKGGPPQWIDWLPRD